jgi:AsmA protein
MRVKLKWLALPLILALVGIASAHWTLSGEALRQELAEQVMRTAGLRATSEGKASFAVLPRPRIKLENVIISDGKGALVIHTDVLRGHLRLWPLLTGKMELSSVQLYSPEISLDYEERPFSRLGAIARAASADHASEEAKMADQARVGTITIVDGTARFQQLGASRHVTLDNINLTLDWSQVSAPMSLNGTFRFQNEETELAAWLAKPADVLRGQQSAASLKLENPGLQFASNGVLSGAPNMQFEGRVTAATRNMTHLVETLGLKSPFPLAVHQVSITSQARASMTSLALSGLKLTADGNAFEGTLAVQPGATRPSVSGTLASDLIVLAPIVAELPDLTNDEGHWNKSPLSLSSLDVADMDLRVSAAKARLGRTTFEDIGASLLLANGQLDLSFGQARVYGGHIKGRLTLASHAPDVNLRAAISFAKIDSGAFTKDASRLIRMTGEADGQISVQGQGETIDEIMRSIDGAIETRFRNGDLHGIDLEQALRRLDKRPLSLLTEMRSGRTGFETALVTAKLNRGTIDLNEALVSGLGVQLALTGKASVAERTLTMRAVARQTGPSAANGPQLMLDIRGPWDDPQIIFDKESLIRRSDAAAPLLRALDKLPAISGTPKAP